MIGYISGKTLFEVDGNIIIDVSGLGYSVAVTPGTLALALQNEKISLFIHTIVRETAFDLYGFETKNELYFFKKLLDVSGIGPRSALAMLSLASTDTLYQAIITDNISFLSSVPGIGKKTAEKMCVELRDKLKDYAGNTESKLGAHDHDVVDALLALGFNETQAHKVIMEIPSNITDTQDRIKYALSQLH